MKNRNKRNTTPMEKLTQGYEKFIKGKEINPNGKTDFNKAVKKSTKGRSSK